MDNLIQSTAFMPPIRTIIVFGDLNYNFQRDLQQLMHANDNILLVDFFARVSSALRHEFSLMPQREKKWLPNFTDLVDLVDDVDKADGAPALRFTLLCVYQIGRFISHFGKPSVVYPTLENTYLLGLCTGSFAAAAISTSQSIVELIPAGIEAVIFAFRTALCSLKLQQGLEKSLAGSPKPWSAVVSLSEESANEMIEVFVEKRGIPKRHRPFISAISPTNVTISGPPSNLEAMLSSTTLKAHYLPIETPYHAPHLYEAVDVDEILDRKMEKTLDEYRVRIAIMCPTSGVISITKEWSFKQLLRKAVRDTLCEQVRWDKILQACATLISQDKQCQECIVLPCVSSAATLLSSALSTTSGKSISISNLLNASQAKDIPRSTPLARFGDSKIAVVGFSGRFPDATSNDEFWELLRSGKDTHQIIPKDRFDWEAHFDPSGVRKNTSRVKYGCFVNEPGRFDARFFRLSPREAEDTDPAQRLALMTTYEALEMAGFVPDRTPSSQRDRVGVFMGTTSDDWREVNSGQEIGTYFIPGGNRAFVPGRITFAFQFSGPSISVDTACSSSFAALHTACQSLWQGGCDTAIAGGTNILTNPDNFAGLDRGHFLSTTGNCNPFDDEASGYCRADAVASLVLKRLEDAEADNDPIFGVIRGVNTNHCGHTVSITRPHEGDQFALFKRILRQSNTNPIDVNYVEMHGTGTQAGDATEMASVLAAMVPGHARVPNHPLYLGAVKANVGHAESASGVTALIKVLLMMKNDEIPPHIGIKNRINKNYPTDLKDRNVNIAFKPTPWRKTDYPGGKRVSFLNNFSAAGGNTAVLLEDAPERQIHETPADVVVPTLHQVTVTANSLLSLKANVDALIRYIDKTPNISLPSLSYTTTARRTHHKFRVSVLGNNIESIKTDLQSRMGSEAEISAIPSAKRLPHVAFTFTGQGRLYPGAAKQLFETVDSFKQDIITFDRIATQHGFPSFLSLVTSDILNSDIVIEKIDTVVAHLSLVCIQMALSNLWVSWGIKPSVSIGHSLGEYPALYAAGVLSASDTIYLVGTRAEHLSRHCIKGSHSMLHVKAPLATVKNIIPTPSCDIACINSPNSTVISGLTQEIGKISDGFCERGLESSFLNIPYAFHSAQVETWVNEFELKASKIQFRAPTIPYISPFLKQIISANESDVLNGSYLARACRGTVDFVGAIEAARVSDATIVNKDTQWLEIGVHPACSSFIKQIMGPTSVTIPSMRQGIDIWKTLLPAMQILYLSGHEIEWNEYHRSSAAQCQVLPLPTYKWDLKNYWIMYRGNFCLTKGDETQKMPINGLIESSTTAPAPYISSSVHRVVEESHATDISTILTESDIHDPCLYPIFAGHKVNGATLCPSSLYADMAFTVVRYMLQANSLPSNDYGLNCTNMKVDRPLIASPNSTSQLLRVSASADWQRGEASLTLFSVNATGRKIANHGGCTVQITRASPSVWLSDWKRSAHFIRSRIASLQQSVDDGRSHKLKRGLAYKLFSSIVEYSDNYQGMQAVVLDAEGLEATARVVFQVGDEGFAWNPCWIDSLGHIAGFIMNGTDNAHLKDHIFINHGWRAMRCAKKIEYGKTYQTYNKMCPEDDKDSMYSGDTYVLEDGVIVAIFEGVQFQRVPRSTLDHLLPSASRVNTTKPEKRSIPQQSTPTTKAIVTTQSKPQPTPAPVPNTQNVITAFKSIISKEAGIEMSDMNSDISFADYGIDSLLSISISTRLQEELGLDLTSSSFIEFPTLNEMISHINSTQPESMSSSISVTSTTDLGEEGHETDSSSLDEEPGIMATIRTIIAEEVGIPIAQLTATTDLGELGVDSLLSLNIIGRLHELDIDVSSTLLQENFTLQEIEKTLSETGIIPLSPSPPLQDTSKDKVPDSFTTSTTTASGPPYATSVRLQGPSKNPSKVLFLFPDGAGSASSYTSLPAISSTVSVYGLNCPWLKNPQDLRCSLPEYVAKFTIEIKRIQPLGPYYFGGWSAGGILAYEAAQQLAKENLFTAKLILFDSPDPVSIQSPPQHMYDFLESLDLFGTKGQEPPSWLRPHFTAFIKMLDEYHIVPFAGKMVPTIHMIYARDGLCKNPGDPRPDDREDDTREMKWLIDNRTDFSGGGWRTLLSEENWKVDVLDDVNHYTMLAKPESALIVSRLVAKYLAV